VKTGYYISGALHAGFLLLILFGGVFSNARPPELSVADVTVLSEAEFAALMPAGSAPEIATEVPAPSAPETAPAPDLPDPETTPERGEPSVADTPQMQWPISPV